MEGVIKLSVFQFSLIYILLLLVLAVMRYSKIGASKMLLIASVKMTIQLVLVGFILEYMFKSSNPILTVIFLSVMIGFAINRVITSRKDLNKKFKIAIGLSLGFSGLGVLFYFVAIVVGESIFNPQYAIPIAGMILGNSMTGINIGIKSFMEGLEKEKSKINTLINLGIHPKDILKPFVNNALETALIPTINSMVGMGIVFLPGMMTGQILSGTIPSTAIMYQIAIMIAICAGVCLTVFLSLNIGYKSLYNKDLQIKIPEVTE